jgi:hypothetical protein
MVEMPDRQTASGWKLATRSFNIIISDENSYTKR